MNQPKKSDRFGVEWLRSRITPKRRCKITFLHGLIAIVVLMVPTLRLVHAGSPAALEISQRPGGKAGDLNVRSPLCPKDVIDFRTCEGVVSGSRDFGLFQVRLPAGFADGKKSWKREGDIWSYIWPYAIGVEVRVEVQPSGDSLKLSYTLKNTGTNVLEAVQLHTCISTTEAPVFFPPPTVQAGKTNWMELYERLWVWSGGQPLRFSDTMLGRSELHLALMHSGAFPVQWGWWVNGPETFEQPLIALTSRDGSVTVALAFEQAIWASANVGDDRACFHLFPWFGRIEPGKSVIVHGQLYVIKGGPHGAFDRAQKDFNEAGCSH